MERVIELARLRREFGDAEIVHVDGVGTPLDDGTFVAIPLYREWKQVQVLLMRSDNFYAALGKVMNATLPKYSHKRVA